MMHGHSFLAWLAVRRLQTFGAALLVAGALMLPASAGATVLYQNSPDLSANQNGSCVYNTVCGPQYIGDTHAAQEFTLSNAATVTSAGFNSIVYSGTPYGTAVNYQILTVTGSDLPGTVLQSGLAAPLIHTAGPVGAKYPTTDYAFDVTPIALAAGSYYFAFQEITTNTYDFLSLGVAACCDAQSYDGGVTYEQGYRGFQSVAVSINGTLATAVPEPGTLGLFGLGLLGLFGLVLNNKRKA